MLQPPRPTLSPLGEERPTMRPKITVRQASSENRYLNTYFMLELVHRKLNVVAQKRPGRLKKTWDEVLVDDRKKLGMDFSGPQNRSEWRGRLLRRLVRQAHLWIEENSL